jgi:hypothetical protein
MEKARDIWRNKIRAVRKPILEQLDIEFMRNTEEGEDTASIVEVKNLLRNFPQKPEIDNASSVAELREIWDTALLGDK